MKTSWPDLHILYTPLLLVTLDPQAQKDTPGSRVALREVAGSINNQHLWPYTRVNGFEEKTEKLQRMPENFG